MQETSRAGFSDGVYDPGDTYTEILSTEPDIDLVCFTDVIEGREPVSDDESIAQNSSFTDQQLPRSSQASEISKSKTSNVPPDTLVGGSQDKNCAEISKQSTNLRWNLSQPEGRIQPELQPISDYADKKVATPSYRLVQLKRKQKYGDGNERAGIGVILEKDANDNVYVYHILFQGPAAESGLIAVGDILKDINGAKLQGMTVKEASAMLYGIEGSRVSILIHKDKDTRSFVSDLSLDQPQFSTELILKESSSYSSVDSNKSTASTQMNGTLTSVNMPMSTGRSDHALHNGLLNYEDGPQHELNNLLDASFKVRNELISTMGVVRTNGDRQHSPYTNHLEDARANVAMLVGQKHTSPPLSAARASFSSPSDNAMKVDGASFSSPSDNALKIDPAHAISNHQEKQLMSLLNVERYCAVGDPGFEVGGPSNSARASQATHVLDFSTHEHLLKLELEARIDKATALMQINVNTPVWSTGVPKSNDVKQYTTLNRQSEDTLLDRYVPNSMQRKGPLMDDHVIILPANDPLSPELNQKSAKIEKHALNAPDSNSQYLNQSQMDRESRTRPQPQHSVVNKELDRVLSKGSPNSLQDIDVAIQHEREMMKSLLQEVDFKLIALGVAITDPVSNHIGDEASLRHRAARKLHENSGDAYNKFGAQIQEAAKDILFSNVPLDRERSRAVDHRQFPRKGCLKRSTTKTSFVNDNSASSHPAPRFRRNILGAALAPTAEVLKPGVRSSYSPPTMMTPHGEMMMSEEGPVPCTMHPFIQAQAVAWQLVNAAPELAKKPVEVVHAMVLEYEVGRRPLPNLIDELHRLEAKISEDSIKKIEMTTEMPTSQKILQWDPTITGGNNVSSRRYHKENEPALFGGQGMGQYSFATVQPPGSPHLNSVPAAPARTVSSSPQAESPLRRVLTPLHQKLISQTAIRSPLRDSSLQQHASKLPQSVKSELPLHQASVWSPVRDSEVQSFSWQPGQMQNGPNPIESAVRSPSRGGSPTPSANQPGSVHGTFLAIRSPVRVSTSMQSVGEIFTNDGVNRAKAAGTAAYERSPPKIFSGSVGPIPSSPLPMSGSPWPDRVASAKSVNLGSRPLPSTPIPTTRPIKPQIFATADF